MDDIPARSVWSRRASLAVALLVLNAALTFENIWPTPAVWWTGGLSVELAVCLLVLIAMPAPDAGPCLRASSRGSARCGPCLHFARYAEVTAPALYGRDVNLYWDLRLMPDVAAMVTRVAPAWLVALAVGVAGWLLWSVHRLFRWAFGRVTAALTRGLRAQAGGGGAVTVVLLFAAQRLGAPIPGSLPSPVVSTYARQAGLVLAGWRGTTSLPPSPPMESTFANIGGADVFLVFVESYGAVSDRADVASGLAASRRQLDADIRDSGRERRFRVRRVTDVRRIVLAGSHQPAQRDRGSRS